MGILFISHSSRNNNPALRVRDWLRQQGWRDTFLDVDPEHGLAPGQRWQEELKRAGERCSAVIVLVSPEWAASRWCVTEFLLASQLGKRVFPVLITPTPFADLPVELTAHFQIADMSRPEIEEDGLNRLRIGLKRAGLDPADFPWPAPDDPGRPPYRGLRTLEEADAAIFFGRDTEITKGLDALRRMRGGLPERMLVVLGASGSGKSSFLRAGLLARLGRDEENFLVLPVLRPERAALTGRTGLARVLGLPGSMDREAIAACFAELRAPVVDRLARYARAGQQTQAARPPTLILAIDQGEELFAAEQTEGAAVCAALVEAMATDPDILAIVTIRSDSFAALQNEPSLSAIPRLPFDLPALRLASFKEVIEGPGRLARPPIRVEEALTAQLVSDLDQADALPLLAFTLERLVLDYGADGMLELTQYRDGLGGLDGAIGCAVEAALAAACEDRRLPDDPAALERLARAAFIPWLLRLEGADWAPKRRVALLRELPPEARPLAEHLVDQRLLVSDLREDGESTVEVSHEAVLRHWRLLGRWIGEEREALAQAEAVLRAAADWRRDTATPGPRDSLLLHRAERLAGTEKLLERPDFAELLGPEGRAYLAACRVVETDRLTREREDQERRVRDAERIAEEQRKVARQTRIGAFIALLLLLIATGFGGIAYYQRVFAQKQEAEAKQQRDQALQNQSMFLVSLSDQQIRNGDRVAGMLLALEALPDKESIRQSQRERPYVVDAEVNLYRSLGDQSQPIATIKVSDDEEHSVFSPLRPTVSFRSDGKIVALVDYMLSGKTRIATWNVEHGHLARSISELAGRIYVNSISFSPRDARLITSINGLAEIWDTESGGLLLSIEAGEDTITETSFSPDGSLILGVLRKHKAPNGNYDEKIGIWDSSNGRHISTIDLRGKQIRTATFSPDASNILAINVGGDLDIWNTHDGKLELSISHAVIKGNLDSSQNHDYRMVSASFSQDGKLIVSGSFNGRSEIWDAHSGLWLRTLGDDQGIPTGVGGLVNVVNSASFSPNGQYIITSYTDTTVRYWDSQTGTLLRTLRGHAASVESAIFNRDGTHIATASFDGTTKVWHAFRNTQELIGHVRTIVPRCLSNEERRAFLLVPERPEWCLQMGKWPSAGASKDQENLLMLAHDFFGTNITELPLEDSRQSKDVRACLNDPVFRQILRLQSLIVDILDEHYSRKRQIHDKVTDLNRDHDSLISIFSFAEGVLKYNYKGAYHEQGLDRLVSFLRIYYGKFQGLSEEQKGLLALPEDETFLRLLPKPEHKCLNESVGNTYESLHHWFLSFWNRRYIEGNADIVLDILNWLNDLYGGPPSVDVKTENVEVENAIAARDYERGAAALQRLVEELEGKAAQPELVDALGQLSYYSLFARNFAQAKDAAERALALDKSQRWIETNLAHALMFTGATEVARARYLGNRGLNLSDGRRWEDAVVADFQQLMEAGLSHPLMTEVEAQFAVR